MYNLLQQESGEIFKTGILLVYVLFDILKSPLPHKIKKDWRYESWFFYFFLT